VSAVAQVTTTVITVALLTACGASPGEGARLALPEGVAPFGATIPNVTRGQPVTFGALPVCSLGSGPVEVTEVAVRTPHGIRVNAYGVASDMGGGFGSDFVDLETAGFDDTAHAVDASCEAPAELAIELERTTAETGTADGFDISYRTSAGGTREVHLPFIVVLCAPEDSQTEDC
jgi:hypothetical protein